MAWQLDEVRGATRYTSNHIPKQQILGMLEPGIQSPPVNKANLIPKYQYPKSKTKIATKLNLI